MAPEIEIQRDGPYVVRGRVPLRRVRMVRSERGEPLTWQVNEPLPTDDEVWLCRCGRSQNKPFCDDSHLQEPRFDGTEAAPASTYDERARTYEAPGIVVRDDRAICEHAGFCATRVTSVWDIVTGDATADIAVRTQVVAMIEHCPSGALTFRLPGAGDDDVEPDLPAAIGVVRDGPLRVTGRISVERSDGEPIEVRNRMTLCRCGQSSIKPLCDGTHAKIGFRDPPRAD